MSFADTSFRLSLLFNHLLFNHDVLVPLLKEKSFRECVIREKPNICYIEISKSEILK